MKKPIHTDRIFLVRGTLDRAIELSRAGNQIEVVIQRRRWPFPEHALLNRTDLVYIAGPLESEVLRSCATPAWPAARFPEEATS